MRHLYWIPYFLLLGLGWPFLLLLALGNRYLGNKYKGKLVDQEKLNRMGRVEHAVLMFFCFAGLAIAGIAEYCHAKALGGNP